MLGSGLRLGSVLAIGSVLTLGLVLEFGLVLTDGSALTLWLVSKVASVPGGGLLLRPGSVMLGVGTGLCVALAFWKATSAAFASALRVTLSTTSFWLARLLVSTDEACAAAARSEAWEARSACARRRVEAEVDLADTSSASTSGIGVMALTKSEIGSIMKFS